MFLKPCACALVLVVILSGAQFQDIDHSSPYCRLSPQHTLCKFQTIGGKCNSLSKRGLDEKSRQIIVQTHNALRSLVASGEEKRGAPGPQPPASNMQVMVWDEELAAIAQRHADQCEFEHDCNDCRKVGRFPVGQNLGLEWTTGPALPVNWKKMITKWYEEVEEFPSTSVARYRFAFETGHYSQMIWAETNRVGCGYTSYLSNTSFTRPVETNLYVCNYGPAGNFLELPSYKIGSPCSQCPAKTVCSSLFPYLCESTKKPSGNTTALLPDPTKTNTSLISSNPTATDSTKAMAETSDKGMTMTTTKMESDIVNTTSVPMTTVLPLDDMECMVGRIPCSAAYRGAPWTFRSELSLPSGLTFLETNVPYGGATELQLNRVYAAPDEPQVCLSLRLRQDNAAEGWIAPPLIIKIQPDGSYPLIVPIQSGEIDQWVELKVSLSHIRSQYKVFFQQNGPAPVEQPNFSLTKAPFVRVALQKLSFKSGGC